MLGSTLLVHIKFKNRSILTCEFGWVKKFGLILTLLVMIPLSLTSRDFYILSMMGCTHCDPIAHVGFYSFQESFVFRSHICCLSTSESPLGATGHLW